MSINSELPDNVSLLVADQLGRMEPSAAMVEFGAIEREVGETFPIWLIDTDAITAETDKLGSVAKDISRATSMIYAGGEPSYSVESVLSGTEVELSSVPSEPAPEIAQRFKAAFNIIDRGFGEADGVVRQIEAPAFRFIGLWLILDDGDEWIFVVDPGTTNLEMLERYDWPTLRNSFIEGNPVLGLVPS